MTDHQQPAPSTPEEWDARYAGADRIWSGRPNPSLVAEVIGLPPGRALDVGCGEGADAVWLARQGWRVTALDVSRVALQRGADAALAAGVRVEWVESGLVEAPLPGSFDLVSAHYPVLRRTPDRGGERALLAAVAPGGTLLVVHHADMHLHAEVDGAHGFDPDDYVWPTDVRRALDDGWVVEVDERRPREVPAGPDGQHTHDLVLRARRLRPTA